jgi:apolipoprotein N-acyltransferase
MYLAFPPISLWGFALLAPIPLAWAAVRGGRFAPGLIALGTVPLWLYEQRWVIDVSALGYPGLVTALAGCVLLLAWAIRAASRRLPGCPLVLLVPTAWTGMEFLRGEVLFGGYPWFLAGQPLIDAPLVPDAGRVLGMYGSSFIAAAFAGTLLDLLPRRGRGGPSRRTALAAAGVWGGFVVLAGAGAVSRPGPDGRVVRLALVQTNIPQDNKIRWTLAQRIADMGGFLDLTRRAAAGGADLIAWPETMFPGTTLTPAELDAERDLALAWRLGGGEDSAIPTTWFADELLALADETGIPMVIGSAEVRGLRTVPARDGGVRLDAAERFNSAVAIVAGRPAQRRYDKVHLTPFGEVMPYVSAWPWLERRLLAVAARGMAFDLSRGTRGWALEVPVARLGGTVRLATPICFEATMPGVVRRLAFPRGGEPADLVLNLTNDGWFGDFDPGRRQHLLLSRWRAVELARPLARCANTGVSALIDARGRVIASGVDGEPGATRRPGVLSVDVPLVAAGARTPSLIVRESLGWGTLAATAGCLIASLLPGARRGGGRRGSAS